MGTYNKGILGNFNGKVGSVVGSTWKGKPVMRSAPPRKRKGQSSDLQLQVQARFTLMTKFLRPLTSLVNQTYNKSAVEMTAFNKAFSDNIKNAITGIYPAITVDYAKVLLSKGSLPNATTPAVASTVAGKLVFTWTDNSGINRALISDIAFVAAYNEELNHWIFNQSAVTRNAGTYSLDVTAFSGKSVQTYIGFVSAGGKIVSNTVYTGMVNVL